MKTLVGSFFAIQAVSKIFEFLSGTLHDVFSEASSGAEVQAQLNSVLESTHNISGMTIDSLNGLSSRLMMLSGVDDEVIGSAEKVLLTFTQIRKDVFPGATQAALDLSKRLGIDLNSAAMLVGKALNDPKVLQGVWDVIVGVI